MATVSTETIYCFKQEFKRVVRYKSRDRQFYITLPNQMPEKEVSADTEAAAIKLFDAAVQVYEKSSTDVTKVILYGYEVDACIYGPDDENNRVNILFNSEDGFACGKTFSDDGITLSLWATICEKSEVVLEGVDNYVSYEEIENNLPNSIEPKCNKGFGWGNEFQEIPWTPENEQFFIGVARAFEQLILKLNSVLGDKDEVIKFITSGAKLLSA